MTQNLQKTVRDPRLDFFRGIAMFIILLAHTPGNTWTKWIPARWGFSDATEIFVFCSGMASAIAFGKLFDRAGMFAGSTRIAYRVWQVYWAHIGLFFFVAMSMAALNASGWFEHRDYVGQLNLYPFFKNTELNLIGLLTLTYVPNYFDILPMYLVILAMIPVVMYLSRIHLGLVALLLAGLWASANVGVIGLFGGPELEGLHFPAQLWFDAPNNTRAWFFNPFGWQLVFFTGFAFMLGWIPRPPVKAWLIGLAAAIVIVNIAYSNIGVRELGFSCRTDEALICAREWRIENRALIHKSNFGLFRYIHFLALAYLSWAAVGEAGRLLTVGTWWPQVVAVIRKVGQQSLAVFVTSMALARFMGVALDEMRDGKRAWEVDYDWINVLIVNLVGFAIIIATAYFVGWIKGQPWKTAKPVEQRGPETVGTERVVTS